MSKKGDMNDNLFCSFCGKNQKEVQKLIAGPAVYICDECIQLCSEIIEEEKEKDIDGMEQFIFPKEIKAMLDDYVIEQDPAKKILAVAVYNHYKRLDSSVRTDDVEKQYPSYWTHRLRKDITGANPCTISKCTLYHC